VTADPLAVLDAIPPEQIGAAIIRLSGRLLAPPEPEDELLTPDQAAAILRVDKRWVYRHGKQLGSVKLSRRKVRFSRARVERYLRGRT